LTLGAVNAYFLFNLALPVASIVHAGAIAANTETGTWMGTGPYTITGFLTGDHVNLTRNDNYWGRQALTRTQTIRFVPEENTRIIMIQNGDFDIGIPNNVSNAGLFEDNENLSLFLIAFDRSNGILFNMNDPLASDYNFRRAIQHTIDRQQMVDFGAGGWAMPATADGTIWGRVMPHRDTSIPFVQQDLGKAREYLAASPYRGETITVLTALPINARMCEVLQQQLAQIGVNIDITAVDVPALHAATPAAGHDHQIVFWGITTDGSPGSMRMNFHPSGAQNKSLYNNPAASAIMDRLPTIPNERDRIPLYMELQRMLVADMPFIPVYHAMVALILAEGVGGVSEISGNHARLDLRWAYRVIGDE
jgi:ABC-type transport system substrate-binding protein